MVKYILVRTVVVAAAVAVILFLLTRPSHIHRRALLSCIHCGNKLEVQVIQRWWYLHSVLCKDICEFPVQANHAHRWFQYNSKLQTSFGYQGWTRNIYEIGDDQWKGDVEDSKLTRSVDKLREDWLQ